MGVLKHGDYLASVELDEEEGLLRGEIINARQIVTFYGESIDELRKEFATSLEVYLDVCRERGIEPEKPFSGKFPVRIDPELHRAISIAAGRASLSLNKWVAQVLEREIEPDA